MTERRRRGSIDNSQELQLWNTIRARMVSLQEIQSKIDQDITSITALQEAYSKLEGPAKKRRSRSGSGSERTPAAATRNSSGMARRRRINKNGQVDSDDPGDEDEDEEEEEEKRRNGMQSRQNEGEDDDVGNDDAEDEDDVVDDDKDDEKAAILTNLDEYYGKLKEETLHEQSLAAEALESLSVLIALRTSDQQGQDDRSTTKRKKRKLDIGPGSPAAGSDASVADSTRGSPAPSSSLTRSAARASMSLATGDGDVGGRGTSSSPAPETPIATGQTGTSSTSNEKATRSHSGKAGSSAPSESGGAAGTPVASTALQATKSSSSSTASGTTTATTTTKGGAGPQGTAEASPATTPTTAARSLTKKERKEILQAQLPLKEGRPVAFRPPGKGSTKGAKIEGGGTDWIQARVVRCIQGDKNRYEVQDVDDAESAEGKPGACYNTTLKAILVLPDPRDKSTYPPQFYPVGSEVIALYPETTSFYKARIVGLPGSGKKQNYKLVFEDDNDEVKAVSVDHVVDVP